MMHREQSTRLMGDRCVEAEIMGDTHGNRDRALQHHDHSLSPKPCSELHSRGHRNKEHPQKQKSGLAYLTDWVKEVDKGLDPLKVTCPKNSRAGTRTKNASFCSIAQASPELTLYPRLAPNSWHSSCLTLPSAGNTGTSVHSQPELRF